MTSAGHVLIMGWATPKEGCLNLSVSIGPLGKCHHPIALSDSAGLGLGLALCVSDKFLGTADLLLGRHSGVQLVLPTDPLRVS